LIHSLFTARSIEYIQAEVAAGHSMKNTLKKRTAFLFLPLFLAFGYMHEYTFPRFTFYTPPQTQTDADIPTNSADSFVPDIAPSAAGNPTSSFDSSSKRYGVASGAVGGAQGSVLGAKTASAATADPNATQTNFTTVASTDPALAPNQSVPMSPGIPNTGVAMTSSSATPTPYNPPLAPILLTPPSTLGGPSDQQPQVLPPPAPSTIGNTIPGGSDATTTAEPSSPPSADSSSTVSTTSETTPPPPPQNSLHDDRDQNNATSTITRPPPVSPPPPVDSSSSAPATSSSGSTNITSGNNSTEHTSSGNVFSTGGVTFRFDDGWQSQYDVALPMLQSAGIKGTFYIVTHQLSDDGFTGFMSRAEVGDLSHGEEVGDHTQTHPHLPTLSTSQQQTEIVGAKNDLADLGITAHTFSYPYGEYTQGTVQIVKDAGFSGAVTTVETAATASSDPFQIESPSLQVSDTPAQVEAMIHNAVQNHQWLIMTFHRIDSSGDQYSMTPENFREIVRYVVDNHVPTVTVSEGAALLK
jgi:peptidoglycan/xylan/chitin deacetylase (PgdA/CDA1 family)